MSLVTRTPLALEISHRDLTNRVNYDAVCTPIPTPVIAPFHRRPPGPCSPPRASSWGMFGIRVHGELTMNTYPEHTPERMETLGHRERVVMVASVPQGTPVYRQISPVLCR
jgi:hypothetical protein